LKKAISAEASGRTSSALPGGQFGEWSSCTSCVAHSPQMRKSHLCPSWSVSPTASYGKTNFSSVKKLFKKGNEIPARLVYLYIINLFKIYIFLNCPKKPLLWGETGQKVSETKPLIFKPFITKKHFQKKFLKEETLGYILVPKQILF
jgi:hypothetical protein